MEKNLKTLGRGKDVITNQNNLVSHCLRVNWKLTLVIITEFSPCSVQATFAVVLISPQGNKQEGN